MRLSLRTFPSIAANEKLNEKFDMNATHMLLINSDLPAKDVSAGSEYYYVQSVHVASF